MPPQSPTPAPQQPPLPYGAQVVPSTPEVEEKVYAPPATFAGEISAGAGRSAKGFLDLLIQAGKPMGPYRIAKDQFKQAVAMLDAGLKSAESGEGRAGQTLSMMENAPLGIGSLVQKAEQAGPGRAKFTPETAGAVTEGALNFAILPKIAESVATRVLPRPPVEAPARQITDAVNPAPRQLRPYQDTLTKHMPDVIEHAKAKGIDLTDPKMARENLATALQSHADELRSQYYDTYIKPNADVQVPTQNIPHYGGGTVDYNTATIQQLDARLTEINATLRPSYERGGASARAAITAESKAALGAEAAVIRNRMNSVIASKMGVDPGQIAGARQKFGALGDAADKTRMAIDRQRYAGNVQKSPVVTDKSTLTRKAGTYVAEKVFNPDRKVANAIKRLEPESAVEMERRRGAGPNPRGVAKQALVDQIKHLEARGEQLTRNQRVRLDTLKEKLDTMNREDMAKTSSAGEAGRHNAAMAQAKQELGANASASDLLKRADEIEREGRK
jgi:hypothetical protein